MKVHERQRADVVLVDLRGDFDAFSSRPWLDEIQRLLETGVRKIVINLRLVKFVNSTGLGSMLKARRQCRHLHGDLVLSQPAAAVREAIEALGLERALPMHSSDDDALAFLQDLTPAA